MTYRGVGILLAFLDIVSWAFFGYILYADGVAHLGWLGAALSFFAMIVALPFLAGYHVKSGHMAKPLVCKECHAVQRADDRKVGFCLRCGGRRVVTYQHPMSATSMGKQSERRTS